MFRLAEFIILLHSNFPDQEFYSQKSSFLTEKPMKLRGWEVLPSNKFCVITTLYTSKNLLTVWRQKSKIARCPKSKFRKASAHSTYHKHKPPTQKDISKEMKCFFSKECLTKGTKILRIKPQMVTVKGIRIKHFKKDAKKKCSVSSSQTTLPPIEQECPIFWHSLSWMLIEYSFWKMSPSVFPFRGNLAILQASTVWASSTIFSGAYPLEETK